jgi:hypothetical protein
MACHGTDSRDRRGADGFRTVGVRVGGAVSFEDPAGGDPYDRAGRALGTGGVSCR